MHGKNALATMNLKLFVDNMELAITIFIHGMFDDQPIPQIIAYSPEDIVRQIKGELVNDLSTTCGSQDTAKPSHSQVTSQESRARKQLDEGKVVDDPSLKVFTVKGINKAHTVTLFPKETCTCPSIVTCYHIIATRMSVGINDEKSPSSEIFHNFVAMPVPARAKKDLDLEMLTVAQHLMLLVKYLMMMQIQVRHSFYIINE